MSIPNNNLKNHNIMIPNARNKIGRNVAKDDIEYIGLEDIKNLFRLEKKKDKYVKDKET